MWLACFLKISIAGTIGIQTSSEVQISKGTFETSAKVQVKVKNTGDEMARDVSLELIEPKIPILQEASSLQPQQEKTWEFAKVLDRGVNGQVPFVFVIHYKDINGYPFSAPSISIAETESAQILSDELKIKGSIHKEGDGEFKLYFNLANTGDHKLRLKPMVVLPEELQLVTRQVPIEIKPESETEIIYQIKDIKAIKGSRYNVFLLLTWEDQNEQRAQYFIQELKIDKDSALKIKWHIEDIILGFFMILLGVYGIRLIRNQ